MERGSLDKLYVAVEAAVDGKVGRKWRHIGIDEVVYLDLKFVAGWKHRMRRIEHERSERAGVPAYLLSVDTYDSMY